MVSEPYGGKLVNRILTGKVKERRIEDTHELVQLRLDRSAKFDVEKIAIGAYSPLEGFMGSDDYKMVIKEGKLTNGLHWTIPITLSPNDKQNQIITKLKEGDDIALIHDDKPSAIMRFEEKFEYDKKELAQNIYGTSDPNHPDVSKLYTNSNNILISGKIDYLQDLKAPLSKYELTPQETRQKFKERGWKSIAAYQTRNPPHVAHEYIQRCALEIVDGLLIHPIIGELKKGDLSSEAIIETYQSLTENYYPKDRVVLTPLSIRMRYAGPKAAIFFAIIRRNYGCTHFIVGRDMAGVGNYYLPYGAHDIFKNLDLGIAPILFRESFYCKRCGSVATDKTCGHSSDEHVKISMTKIREMLTHGQLPPKEAMRPEIAKILEKHVKNKESS